METLGYLCEVPWLGRGLSQVGNYETGKNLLKMLQTLGKDFWQNEYSVGRKDEKNHNTSSISKY